MIAEKGEAEEPAPQTAVSTVPVGAIQDDRQRDLGFSEELRDLISVERERIESQNKRTEVVRLAVEMNDAADKRQFEFQMAQLHAQTGGSKRKYIFASWVAGSAIIGSTALACLLFTMLFWGNGTQSDMALSVLKIAGYGLGGYGAIGAVIRGAKTLTNSIGKSGGA